MTKRQRIEDNILNDILFGQKQYGSGPEYKEKVKSYFEGLLKQVREKGSVTFSSGITVECDVPMIEHYYNRYASR